MTARGKVLGWVLLGVVAGMLGQGCGANSSRQYQPGGPRAGSGGKDTGTMTVEPPGGQSGDGSVTPYNELCGIPDSNFCVPDDPMNSVCRPSIGGSGSQSSAGRSAGGASGSNASAQGGEAAPGGAGGEPNASNNGGAPGGQGGESTLPGGAAGATASGEAGDGGETGQGTGAGPAGGRAGAAGGAGTPTAVAGSTGNTVSPTSCQVAQNPQHRARPLARCLPAGTGKDSEACFSGADCQAGFACVGQGPGQCRQYCCSGASSCRENTHCTVESLVPLEASGQAFEVPVCMPAVDCSLAEPYPCPEGVSCSCPVESACIVVGNDATTSCVPASTLPAEGKGSEGKPCPCGWGFVCSQATNECVKLCQVAAVDQYCGGARCQPSTALPVGWGTCVGVPPKGAGSN